MLELKIHNEFHGPTLLQLEPVLSEITAEKIDVLWKNTKAEIAVLEQHPEKTFVLYVPDFVSMERAAEQLGLPVKFDINTLGTAKLALLSRVQTWDEFTKSVGSAVSRGILIKLVSKAIKQGIKVNDTLAMTNDILFEGVPVTDADIFIRIHKLRGL
jgi:hypothetical protein